MNYILLIMLFVTAPSAIKDTDKGTKNDHRVWALQSATTMEVSSGEWCNYLANTIDGTMATTATVTTRMFCIPKNEQEILSGAKAHTFGEFTKGRGPTDKQVQCEIENAITVGPRPAKKCN